MGKLELFSDDWHELLAEAFVFAKNGMSFSIIFTPGLRDPDKTVSDVLFGPETFCPGCFWTIVQQLFREGGTLKVCALHSRPSRISDNGVETHHVPSPDEFELTG